MRGDIHFHILRRFINPFQSTPLCEGRRFTLSLFLINNAFQSTPLCEGRRECYLTRNKKYEFQSTPLCEGRRDRH